jgi:hypothetical protein
MAFLWEVIITVFFWGFILSTIKLKTYSGTKTKAIKTILDHTLPLILLTSDWCFNSIGFEYSQILTNICGFLVYALINCLYVVLKGETIYPILTWDSWQAYLIALSLVPVGCLINLLLIVCTNFKIDGIDKKKWEEETQNEDLETLAVLIESN